MDYSKQLEKYFRLSNYISAAMLYLKDNTLLEQELQKEHIKTRILGHWGTVPGLNLIYGGAQIFAKKYLESEVIHLPHPTGSRTFSKPSKEDLEVQTKEASNFANILDNAAVSNPSFGKVPQAEGVASGANIPPFSKEDKGEFSSLSAHESTGSKGGNNSLNITNTAFIAGPGHGAPAILSGLFFEGTLEKYYPDAKLDKSGLGYIIKQFSWPGGFQSHTWPGLPGQFHEGGELGYSLGTAFGAVMDKPNTLIWCVVGDGEAETGTLSASWYSNKFINHKKDGIVIPILHLNGYKISGPTLFSAFTDEELNNYFNGLGYEPIIVDLRVEGRVIASGANSVAGNPSSGKVPQAEGVASGANSATTFNPYSTYLSALDQVYQHLLKYKSGTGKLPVLILKTKKGWTGPKELKGEPVEDNNLSHGIPLQNPKKNDEEFRMLKDWLESYKVQELINDDGSLIDEIKDILPSDNLLLGNFLDSVNTEKLILPRLEDHSLRIFSRGTRAESRMVELAKYLRDVLDNNTETKNFRIFSPDESESNFLQATFQETDRMFNRKFREWDHAISDEGRIMEILSENVLQAWFEGYVKTGGHGIFLSYEAFLPIITSQVEQFIKYLKQESKYYWRKEISSLNYVATSTGWRQDHNGFTHQNPGFITSLLSNYADFVNVYFPADGNILVATTEEMLKLNNSVNLLVACKRDIPQWLTKEEAVEHVKKGLSEWKWAGNYGNEKVLVNLANEAEIIHLPPSKEDLELQKQSKDSISNTVANSSVENPSSGKVPQAEGVVASGANVDIVLASAGDYQTQETLAATVILKEMIPEIKFKYINVNEISRIGIGTSENPLINEDDFDDLFTKDKPVIFNFHGYPEVIKLLTWDRPISSRLTVLGYIEQGGTTTPFDMQVVNKASRYHVVLQVLDKLMDEKLELKEKMEEVGSYISGLLEKHKKYIVDNGDDIPEVKEFEWRF